MAHESVETRGIAKTDTTPSNRVAKCVFVSDLIENDGTKVDDVSPLISPHREPVGKKDRRVAFSTAVELQSIGGKLETSVLVDKSLE